jgi:hypothetical protein
MRRPDAPAAETLTSSYGDASGGGEWLAPEHDRTVLELSRALAAADDREGAAVTATGLIALASGATFAAVAEPLGSGGGFPLLAAAAAGACAERGDGVPRRLRGPAREAIRTPTPVWFVQRDRRERATGRGRVQTAPPP